VGARADFGSSRRSDIDDVESMLYEGRTAARAPAVNPGSAVVAYARKVLAGVQNIGAPAIFRMYKGATDNIVVGGDGGVAALRSFLDALKLAGKGQQLGAGNAVPAAGEDGELVKIISEYTLMTAARADGGAGYLGLPATTSMLNYLIDHDHQVPVDVLLMRPWMEYSMSSAVLMKAGTDTGATFVGHSDFLLGDDVVSKLHYGNFTFYSKSLVTNPKNVIITPNIFCQGYNGGNSTDFFKVVHPPLAGDDGGVGVGRVPAYHPQQGKHDADIISVVLPYGTAAKLNNPLNIGTSKADHTMKITFNGKVKGHYHDADIVENLFSLCEFGKMDDCEDDDTFRAQQRTQNKHCYRGHQFAYDPSCGMHSAVTRNTGHWGPNVYPGCGRVRAGEMKYLEKQNYSSAVCNRGI
jgi:hypothetical protein